MSKENLALAEFKKLNDSLSASLKQTRNFLFDIWLKPRLWLTRYPLAKASGNLKTIRGGETSAPYHN